MRFYAEKTGLTSHYSKLSCDYLSINPNSKAFTLVEIMIAMLIMAAAIVPVVALMTDNAKQTNVGEAYSSMMHQSTRILDTLLERVRYSDIVAAAILEGTLPNAASTNEAIINNIFNIIDLKAVPPRPYFDTPIDFEFNTIVNGRTAQYADPGRKNEPIVYTLKIQQVDRELSYLKNKNVTGAGDIPNINALSLTDIGKVFVTGKLMRINLTVEWGTPKPGVTRPYQNIYTLTTFKAKLED
jgi:prepilin-type N-terminal cleavage/methylation domain-containing protein